MKRSSKDILLLILDEIISDLDDWATDEHFLRHQRLLYHAKKIIEEEPEE